MERDNRNPGRAQAFATMCLLAISACQGPIARISVPPVERQEVIHLDDTLETARAAYMAMDNASSKDRAIAAAELAVATDSAGNSPAAVAILSEAFEQSISIASAAERAQAMQLIISGQIDIEDETEINQRLTLLRETTSNIARAEAHWQAMTQVAMLESGAGNYEAAFDIVDTFPTDKPLSTYKSLALYYMAPKIASNGDFDVATRAISANQGAFIFYLTAARTSVAMIARENGKIDLAGDLITEAIPIARNHENGYFLAGALRRIGEYYAFSGNRLEAMQYFNEAIAAARNDKLPNPRALSRVSTALSDHGFFDEARALLPESQQLIQNEEDGDARAFAYYELAGSAAFAGEFTLARSLVNEIPYGAERRGNSLRDAAERDVAWGFAKWGRLEDAIAVAEGIRGPRERVQALSRIARVLNEPAMPSLPRFL